MLLKPWTDLNVKIPMDSHVTFRGVLLAGALALSAVLAASAPARAWVPHTATITAVRASTAPAIDPWFSDPVWKTGVVFEKFYNFTTHQPAALETTAYLLYDSKNLYFAVHCARAGIPIVATQTVDHAGVATDDHWR